MEGKREFYYDEWQYADCELGADHPDVKRAKKLYDTYMEGRIDSRKMTLDWLKENIHKYTTVTPYSTSVDIDWETLEEDYYEYYKSK